jgi:hypothetical protein
MQEFDLYETIVCHFGKEAEVKWTVKDYAVIFNYRKLTVTLYCTDYDHKYYGNIVCNNIIVTLITWKNGYTCLDKFKEKLEEINFS